jgi:Flp pilus assembly CpaF family ATPase
MHCIAVSIIDEEGQIYIVRKKIHITEDTVKKRDQLTLEDLFNLNMILCNVSFDNKNYHISITVIGDNGEVCCTYIVSPDEDCVTPQEKQKDMKEKIRMIQLEYITIDCYETTYTHTTSNQT